MRRLLLILCSVLVYAGCGSGRQPPVTGPPTSEPVRRETIRVVLPESVSAASLPGHCQAVDVPADEADVAVVYASSGPSLEASGFRVERIPAWDRTYALWFDTSARWVNDPTLRAWIGRRLDRGAMIAYLFGGEGSPAYRLLDPEPASFEDPGPRPVSSGARPRLGLSYDTSDRYAGILASRIKAELERDGFQVTLLPADRPPSMILVAHQPGTGDAVEDLETTVRRLGPGAEDALAVLETASWAADESARLAVAERAEASLLDDARLVPLIRLHAWLVTRDGLVGVGAGAPGVLDLENAGWVE